MLYEVITPDRHDAAFHQRVTNGLRLRSGHGDDADVDIHVAANARELAHRQNLLAGDLAAGEVRVYVKRRDDARITSYNVCYTKLLRANFVKKVTIKKYL